MKLGDLATKMEAEQNKKLGDFAADQKIKKNELRDQLEILANQLNCTLLYGSELKNASKALV